MTIRECYEKLNGDYDDVIERLGTDSLAERFLLKFTGDKTYETLKQAAADGDIVASFKAAHTLKGVAANLSFTSFCEAVSQLTEQLRDLSAPADEKLMAAVEERYMIVISAINEYTADKNI